MNIKCLREKKSISQIDLANQMNVTQATISSWESGKANPTADKLMLLSNILECKIDELFEYEPKFGDRVPCVDCPKNK